MQHLRLLREHSGRHEPLALRLRTPRGTVEEQSLIQRDGLEVKLLRRERIMPQPARVNPDGSQAEAGRDISSLMRQ